MPAPYYSTDGITLHLGNCLDVLREMGDASVDAVVTDPPYEIGIAGQDWDRSGIAYSVDLWRECLRVLKPGGHLLSFGAPRTYHRMVCAAEDAGFRVIDQLDWIYTHGKPKGADLARAVDRHRDDREQVLQVTAWLAAARDTAGWTNRRIDALFEFSGMGGLWTAGIVLPTLRDRPTGSRLSVRPAETATVLSMMGRRSLRIPVRDRPTGFRPSVDRPSVDRPSVPRRLI